MATPPPTLVHLIRMLLTLRMLIDPFAPRLPRWKPRASRGGVCGTVGTRTKVHTYRPGRARPHRTSQSVWGYHSSHYGVSLGTEVVSPKIFINWGIQPWFWGVWNLDRVFLYGDQLWHMEIKQEYPMEHASRLYFGISDGELGQIASVLNCGLRTSHVVTVNPFWGRNSGSMYLLNDIEARSRAAILARELTPGTVSSALGAEPAGAAVRTSITGRSRISFRRFEANTFRTAGMLSNPPTRIASAFVSQMCRDQLPPACTDAEIRALRIITPRNRRGAVT